jgi:hypothetical protein
LWINTCNIESLLLLVDLLLLLLLLLLLIYRSNGIKRCVLVVWLSEYRILVVHGVQTLQIQTLLLLLCCLGVHVGLLCACALKVRKTVSLVSLLLGRGGVDVGVLEVREPVNQVVLFLRVRTFKAY